MQDAGLRSDRHDQYFGISQGCPLCPFVFSILLTVLLHDAAGLQASQRGSLGKLSPEPCVNELVYADDTMVLAISGARAELCMNSIAEAGAIYVWNRIGRK